MMKTTKIVAAALLTAASTFAQAQFIRGDVADVPGTNDFFLKCTTIPLVSNTLNLRNLVGQNLQWIMQVNNVGTPSNPVLNVTSAQPTQKIHDMGNLRFGRSERWQVFGDAGSLTATYVDATALTGSYLPLPGVVGAWFMGGSAALLTVGRTNQLGVFEFSFTMPTIPALVGVSFSSQSLIVNPTGTLTISNTDCKTVRND